MSKMEDILKQPPKEKMQFETECGASWQLITNGSIGNLKCRHCGVYVVNGGTPKCLKNEKK